MGNIQTTTNSKQESSRTMQQDDICWRDSCKTTIGGITTINYGTISFVKNGCRYDLNKVMQRHDPEPGSIDGTVISGGIIIAGVTLYYPRDFFEYDKEYDSEQIKHKHSISSMVDVIETKQIEKKQPISIGDESKEIIAIKYPNLNGRYFKNVIGMNMNKIISCDMTDEQRADFFENYDRGYTGIESHQYSDSVRYGIFTFNRHKSSKYVQIGVYRFEEHPSTKKIIVSKQESVVY
jgi:hypothetical protein